MKTIRASRIAALFLAVFLIISLFPTAGLAEDNPGETAPVAESVPEAPPAEPEEQVEAQSVDETEGTQEEIADEEVPEALPVLPEEQVQDENTDEQVEPEPSEPEPSEPVEGNPQADPPEDPEEQVQAQGIDDDVKAMEAETPEENKEPEKDDSDDLPPEFTVTLEDYTCKYDGEEHSSDKTPVCVPSDETATYTFAFSFEEEGEYTDDLASLKKTDAGEYTIYVKATNSDGKVATAESKMIINRREVKVKVADSEAVYNGSEQYGSEELVFEGLLEGHEASIDYEPATGTEVGIHDNGSFVPESFNVVVKPENEEDTPEGEETEEKNTGEEDTEEKENNGDGDGENTTDDGDDTPETVVTSNYILTEMTPGKLVINPVDVSISSADETWTYDGNEHSKPEYTVLCGGETVTPDDDSSLVFTLPQTGDKLTITEPAKVKNVSDTAEGNNTFSYELTNAGQYDVQMNFGTLTIQKMYVKVTITGHNNKTVYDGKEHSVRDYDVACSEKLYDQNRESNISFTGNAYASRTNVSSPSEREGTTYMGLKEDQFKNRNTNFNAQFEVVDGYQTIEKRYLSIKVKPQSYVYNGESQGENKQVYSDQNVISEKVEVEGLQGRDKLLSITLNGQQTEVGTYTKDGIALSQVKIGSDLNTSTTSNRNYEIHWYRGTMTITRAPLTIKVKPQSYEYTGKPQGEDNKTYTDPAEIGEKVEVKGLQGKDKLLSITLNGQQTEVGTYKKEKSIALSNVKIGTDPKSTAYTTKNYEIHWSRSTLEITEANSGNSSTGGSSKTSGSRGNSRGSGSSSSRGSSSSSYDYSSGNSYYSGGYSNPSNTAQAESAVVSYEVPLEIGVVNTGTGESYE